MIGIVLQLQAEAIDDKVNIEALLRKAYLVARKLKLEEFEKWISDEQNGYKSKVPDYRIVGGQIKAWNPYAGWMPIIMSGEIADITSKMPLGAAISAINDAYNSIDGSIALCIPGSIAEALNENTDGLDTNYKFFISKTELYRIMSVVRNRILAWAILLEENGIIGENLMFSNEEVETAINSSVINNYTNNFYANVENTEIDQGNVGNK